jgi:hypothetical protein
MWGSLQYFLKKLNPAELNKLALLTNAAQGGNGIKNILYLSATPKDLDPLQTGAEYDLIATSLQAGAMRDGYALQPPVLAVTLKSFLDNKHLYKPWLLHFSGHGVGEGLMFANAQNTSDYIANDVVEEIFKGVEEFMQCIVLNACHASTQAALLSKKGIRVVGMKTAVKDEQGLFFSKNFYSFIANGQQVDEAFANTMTLLKQAFPQSEQVPELWLNGAKQ